MQRNLRLLLEDILHEIGFLREAVGDRPLAEYSGDLLLKHATERGVEIISEAARRLPEGIKNQRPEIPWRRIVGIGNVLRHEYHRIVDRVIYDLIQDDMRRLEATILAIRASLDDTPL